MYEDFFGGGFLVALSITLIILKLCHVIMWPWWWIVSPIWITAGCILVAIGVSMAMAHIKASKNASKEE